MIQDTAGILPASYSRMGGEVGVTDSSYQRGDLRRYNTVQNAINSCGLGGFPLRITAARSVAARLVVTTPGMRFVHEGGSLTYTGPSTDRLMDIRGAADFVSDAVIYSGNDAQPLCGLIYIDDNSPRPAFLGGSIGHIAGTHAGGVLSNMSNSMYGVVISPYGVEDATFDRVRFVAISNDNTGLNMGGSPLQGCGFAGGVFPMKFDNVGLVNEGFNSLAGVQAAPSGAVFDKCVFEDIKTILPNGLSENDHITYDDADAIRMYGDAAVPPVGVKELFFRIRGCMFRRVSKRAVKGSVGQYFSMTRCTVDARGMTWLDGSPRNMVTPVKLEKGCSVDGLDIIANPTVPVILALQSHDGDAIKVHNVYVTDCNTFYNFAPTDPTETLNGFDFDTIRVERCYFAGMIPSTAVARVTDFRMRHITIAAAPGVHTVQGLVTPNTSSGFSGVNLEDVHLINCDLKVIAYDAKLKDCEVQITDAAFAGTAGRGLVEIGTSPSATRGTQAVHGLRVQVDAIPVGFITALRNSLVTLVGNDATYSDIVVNVPETLVTTFPHCDIYGSNVTLDGFDYDGPGRCHFSTTAGATYGPYKNVTMRNLSRKGNTTVASTQFMYLDHGQSNVIKGVVDYRDGFAASGAGSITINGGTIEAGRAFAYVISDVTSRTTSPDVVSPSTGLISTANIVKF